MWRGADGRQHFFNLCVPNRVRPRRGQAGDNEEEGAGTGHALCSVPAHPAIRETIEHHGYVSAALTRRLEVAEIAFELRAEGAAAKCRAATAGQEYCDAAKASIVPVAAGSPADAGPRARRSKPPCRFARACARPLCRVRNTAACSSKRTCASPASPARPAHRHHRGGAYLTSEQCIGSELSQRGFRTAGRDPRIQR